MEKWLIISLSVNLFLMLWTIAATKDAIREAKENIKLDNQVSKLTGQLMTEQIRRLTMLETSSNSEGLVDQTSEKLINLAVKNPNENEARSAALRACQRIHKQINK